MICEKCGYVPTQSAKFCEKCGSLLVADPIAQPSPILEQAAAEEKVFLSVPTLADLEPAQPAYQEVASQEEALVYNPEVVAVQESAEEIAQPEQEPVFAPVQSEPFAPVQEAPVPPVQPEPAAVVQEAPAPVFQEPPAGAPLFSAPAYHGAIPNAVPTYYGNAPAYGAQGYPNMPGYGAPGYYNAPVYGGVAYAPPAQAGYVPGGQQGYTSPAQQSYAPPVQAYSGAPVYAAPVGSEYAPVYAPANHGAEPAAAPKTVSIIALLGSIIAIVAVFLKLINVGGASMFKLVSDALPELFDNLEYLDRFVTLDYLVLAIVLICLLCMIFAAIVFLLACLKKKCRGCAIFAMVLAIALPVLFILIAAEMSYRPIDIDFEMIANLFEGLGTGYWLYLVGMLMAAIDGGKRGVSANNR